MKKIVAVIAAVVVLLSSMSFLVSATDQGQHLYLKSAGVIDNATGVEYDKTSDATWEPNDSGGMRLTIVHNPDDVNVRFYGMSVTWQPAGYTRIPAGYSYNIDMSFIDQYTVLPGDGPTIDTSRFIMIIRTDDDRFFKLTPSGYINDGTGEWDISYGMIVADDSAGDGIYIKEIGFATTYPSINNGLGSYTIDVYTELSKFKTDEQMHNEIINKLDSSTQIIVNNQNENTAAIIGALQEQTDVLVNGWTADIDPSSDVNDVVYSVEDAESAALGGKSDNAIKSEFASVFKTNSTPQANIGAAATVGWVFDKLLDAFGPGYQSVLILALTLGLAAFVIGRTYRAKGD